MEESKTVKRKGRKVLMGALVVFLLLAVGSTAILFIKYQDLQQANSKQEREQIVSKIEDVVALPDEQPSLSTVVDASKFANPALKARAQNGDKLLIYTKAKQLILYRPSTQKVIDMLAIQDTQPASAIETKTTD